VDQNPTVDISVEIVPTEELAESQRAAVVELCVAAHRSEEFRKMFTVYFRGGGRHFLGYADGELVSHAVVTTRDLQPEGQRILRTAFVDAVSTLPRLQGQGFGTATMARLAESIDDYEVGCLQTDRTGFYSRLGWELWRGPLAGRDDDRLIPTPEQLGVMVLRLAHTPPLDLDAGLSIERQPHRIWE
jgi:aminoglycoside 2'-N-acetyltransferase I